MTETPATDDLIAEILAGLEGVTPGPWERGKDGNGDAFHVYCDDKLGTAICQMSSEYNSTPQAQRIRNLDHIARCSPENIRALLARIQPA